jgi:DNA-directed RNA polymerase subunit beta'
MGHVELASPVIHFWYLKGISSPLSTLLGIKRNVLRKIAYYETEPLNEEVFLIKPQGKETTWEMIYRSQYDILSRQKEMVAEPAFEVIEEFEVKAKAAGKASFEDMDLENGQKMIRIVIEDQQHIVTQNALLEIKDGAKVKEGDLICPSPASVDELLTETQHSVLAEAYPDLQANKIIDVVDSLIFLVTKVHDASVPFKVGDLLWEPEVRTYEKLYPRQFDVAAGAEGIQGVLNNLDMRAWAKELKFQIVNETTIGRTKRLLKRLEVVDQLGKSGNKAGDLVMTIIPVLPPELRPIVQLEGGKFATTDLNDLYRRIINRNNRLKKLREMGAPEIILRNERRMLQEAVDALIHNEKKENPILGRDNRPLKSLSERIQGKHGRLRRNLLGKRVDYSGRAVIVVNPKLKLHQCGIPKKMALELFKPFILRELSHKDAHNISNYDEIKNKALSGEMPEVWDILDRLIGQHPVLLNRAPTLHRLGIQAFEPTLVDGEAIQIHPFVCPPYNADFDGDQMAVHLPLSPKAIAEARERMLSSNNILSPSHGGPLTMPAKDFVFAIFYLTLNDPNGIGAGKAFADLREADRAYECKILDLHADCRIRLDGVIQETTLGRAKFNLLLPEGLRNYEKGFSSKEIEQLFMDCYHHYGNARTVELLDALKEVAIWSMTRSGLTISVTDALIPPQKKDILKVARGRVADVNNKYDMGWAQPEDRREANINIWMETVDRMEKATMENLSQFPFNTVRMVVQSGARGSSSQVKQLAGMRGPMSDPSGRIIEMPVISNFREGLSVTEYFISTHGGRKGTADTALKTAESGYLTRRLVDVAEELIIQEIDCGAQDGIEMHPLRYSHDEIMEPITDRVYGRVLAEPIRFDGEILMERNEYFDREKSKKFGTLQAEVDVKDKDFVKRSVGTYSVADVRDPKKNHVIIAQDEYVSSSLADRVVALGVKTMQIRPRIVLRSALNCETRRGMCQMCYGLDLSKHKPVAMDTAVGVIAAQSIGEPGTQLTMRTFHTGGVVGDDITQGLPRAEELFEARKSIKSPEGEVARIPGVVTDIIKTGDGYEEIRLQGDQTNIRVPSSLLKAKKGETVPSTSILATKSPVAGSLHIIDSEAGRHLYILSEEDRVYSLPNEVPAVVKTGDWVKEGDALSDTYNEEPVLAQCDGAVIDFSESGERFIAIEDSSGTTYQHRLPFGARKKVEVGEKVTEGMQLSTRSAPHAVSTEVAGMAIVGDGKVIVYTPDDKDYKTFQITENVVVVKDDGAHVKAGEELFSLNIPKDGECVIDHVTKRKTGLADVELHYEMLVPLSSKVRLDDGRETYLLSAVKIGDKVEIGDLLSKGVSTPHLLLKVAGVEKARIYLLTEIHKVYKSQGVDINDKHIELIIRRMLNNVKINDPGDSNFFPNQLVILEEFRAELVVLNEENRVIQRERESYVGESLAFDIRISEEDEPIATKGQELTYEVMQACLEASIPEVTLDRGGNPVLVRIMEKRMPEAERALLRISKAALETKSWLSAASFQRTTTVLAEAAMRGSEDPLQGLKPNVIIGKLIKSNIVAKENGVAAENGDGVASVGENGVQEEGALDEEVVQAE